MRRALILGFVCLMLLGGQAMLAEGNGPTKEEYAAMSLAERMAAKAEAEANAKMFTGKLQTGIDTKPPQQPQPATPTAINGTLIYDTGTFSVLPTQPLTTADTLSYGNQFNTTNGNPIPAPSVTVTQIAVWPALLDGNSTGTGGAFMTIFGPVNTAGTNATPIDSTNQTGMNVATWNTVAQSGVVSPTTGTGTAATFLIGLWGGSNNGTGTPCANDCVGLDTSGTVNGQGFHGMRVDDFGGADFGTISDANALIRAIGNVLPVELMTFTID